MTVFCFAFLICFVFVFVCFVVAGAHSQSSQPVQTSPWFCGGKTLKYGNSNFKNPEIFKWNELSSIFFCIREKTPQISWSFYEVSFLPRRAFKCPPDCSLMSRSIREIYLKIHSAHILRSAATYNFVSVLLSFKIILDIGWKRVSLSRHNTIPYRISMYCYIEETFTSRFPRSTHTVAPWACGAWTTRRNLKFFPSI